MEGLKRVLPFSVYETLIDAKFTSVAMTLTYSYKEIALIAKLDENISKKVLKECAKLILKNKVYTANDLPKWQYISSGCSSIDEILGGGIPLKGITEIVGCSGVGKTQFCLQLALMAQLPITLGGVKKAVVYICTEDAFPIKRFKELSEIFTRKFQCSDSLFNDDLFIEHVADTVQLKICILEKIPKLLHGKALGLVVIDSIAGAFRSDNLDVNYINRSQDFMAIAVKLQNISQQAGCAVICVNQVVDNIQSGQTEPSLGLAWSNLVTSRFGITRNVNFQWREFEIIFSPYLKQQISRFVIAKEGLISYQEDGQLLA